MSKLESKVAVVTGGASGIGLAIARRFAREGAAVALIDRDGAQLAAALVAVASEGGGEASGEECDVADPGAVEAAIARIRDRHHRIDILVNNAGIAHVGNATGTPADEFERVQRVNVFGVANCLRSALPVMIAGGGGSVLNLASIVSVMGIPDRFAYSASKGAVLAMTYSVARDYLGEGIRCNALLPGRVHTPFVDGFIARNYPGRETEMFEKLSRTQPIGRMGTPEEIAAAALFLCSDDASFITGVGFPVDGGTITIR